MDEIGVAVGHFIFAVALSPVLGIVRGWYPAALLIRVLFSNGKSSQPLECNNFVVLLLTACQIISYSA